jgi:long-chain fatty acid transport protein
MILANHLINFEIQESMNHSISWAIRLIFVLNLMSNITYGMVAGGRPNSISGGHNAFAGVVNPANAVWIEDRFDIGLFLVHQKSSLNNKNNNPLFNPGKINQTYKAEILSTPDAAIHKRGKIKGYECSISFAAYTTPSYVKVRTKKPIPLIGKTPIRLEDKTQVFSSIFSLKLNENHSIGFALDYSYLSHLRNGFQNSDNPLRSVSPGHVTNKGKDHSHGLGLTLGWRWNINKSLAFGLAIIKKSYVGQYRKYRGYEPHHAKNYIPVTIGGGFTYRFTEKIAGRLEVLWTAFGNLPNSNNTILPNGKLNTHKRGSNKSSGSGLQDATFINLGLGYKVNTMLSLGIGLSHRVKLARKSRYIISHSYIRQTIYNLVTFGVNYNYHHHDFFFTLSHGFENHQSGYMPEQIGGGKFTSMRSYNSLSLAWGYLY